MIVREKQLGVLLEMPAKAIEGKLTSILNKTHKLGAVLKFRGIMHNSKIKRRVKLKQTVS